MNVIPLRGSMSFDGEISVKMDLNGYSNKELEYLIHHTDNDYIRNLLISELNEHIEEYSINAKVITNKKRKLF